MSGALTSVVIGRNHRRHCERSEAIQGNVGRPCDSGSPRRFTPRDDGSMLARRGFLKAMGATFIVAGGLDATAGRAQTVPWSAGTEPPKLKAPPNACDCHMHIY